MNLSTKKIAVFGADLFWSSSPYECLNVYEDISKSFDVDYVMFENDIRLNKSFSGEEKFFFETEKFKKCENLRTIKTWGDLYKLSADYRFIVARCKIAPKTRHPREILTKNIKCPWVSWDTGGLDILAEELNNRQHTNLYLPKGNTWKKYIDSNLSTIRAPSEISLCPQYDPYYRADLVHNCKISKHQFYEKYGIKKDEKYVLVAPSNPGSHVEQFKQNIKTFESFLQFANKHNFKVLVKTYPHDYVYYEKEVLGSGIYKRRFPGLDSSQYEYFSNKYSSELVIVDSQDHHVAVENADKIYNMSGSSIAWETFFSEGVSYSMNYKEKKYYDTVDYLDKSVKFPDSIFNINIQDVSEIFSDKSKTDKKSASDFFTQNIEQHRIDKSLKRAIDKKII